MVRTVAALALVVMLAAVLVGAYLGEWPWVWDLFEFVAWLLELL